MVSRAAARKILQTYGKAWTKQDVPLILSIFSKDGTYQERWYEQPFKGHKAIARYWTEKVVKEQSNIHCRLLNYWVCGNVIFAEFEASFYSSTKRAGKHGKWVGIFELKGNKIKKFREYWHYKTTP
jgi:limonene-1,2-epoxide hydrolase